LTSGGTKQLKSLSKILLSATIFIILIITGLSLPVRNISAYGQSQSVTSNSANNATLPRTGIPSYSVDANGTQQALPVYAFTPSGQYEVGIKWSPVTIVTGQNITFILDFYDRANDLLHGTPYYFVLTQNGKELDRSYALTEDGIGVFNYILNKPGPLTIQVQDIASNQQPDPSSSVKFTTYVYPNPSSNNSSTQAAAAAAPAIVKLPGGTEQAPGIINPFTLPIYGLAVGLPAAGAVIFYLHRQGRI
jgi:hypothetical protein